MGADRIWYSETLFPLSYAKQYLASYPGSSPKCVNSIALLSDERDMLQDMEILSEEQESRSCCMYKSYLRPPSDEKNWYQSKDRER